MGSLERNLEALRQVEPQITEWIRTGPEDSWFSEIKSADGTPNLLIQSGPQKILAYDREKPLTGPRSMAQAWERYKENTSIVLGMGSGHLVKAIFDEAEPGHTVVVIESSAHLVRVGLANHDFGDPIRAGHLRIAGPGPEEIAQVLMQLEQRFWRGDIRLDVEAFASALTNRYQPLADHARKIVNQIGSNNSTVTQKGAEISSNEVIGLPYTIRQRGVIELQNLYQGKPAILVSTGPSLGKNIHLLKEAQSKAVIISTAQALRSLLAYGVTPDFICTIDFGENMSLHLTGLMATEDVPLVALCRTHAALLRDYQGQLFVNGAMHGDANHYLAQLWQHKGIINSGNSVAHLNYALATFMGCDPVVFIGQDLALSETDHFDQVDHNARLEQNPDGSIHRRIYDPRSKYHEEDIGEIQQIMVPGYYGGQVPTLASFLSFITLFERMFELNNHRIINATQGGAKLQGTEQMPLRQVIEEVLGEDVDRSVMDRLKGPASSSEMLVEQLSKFLNSDLEVLNQLDRWIRLALATNTGLTNLLINPEIRPDDPQGPFQRLLTKNSNYSNRARDLSGRIASVQMALHGTVNRIERRDMNIRFRADDREVISKRLIRNRIILEAAREATEKAVAYFQDTHTLLRDYLSAKEKAGEDAPSLVRLGDTLRLMGEHQEAQEAYDLAREMDPDLGELWQARGQLALQREKCFDVEEAIEELTRLGLDRPAAELQAELDNLVASWLDTESDFESEIFVRPLVNLTKYLAYRPGDEAARKKLALSEAMREAKIEESERFNREVVQGETGREWRYRELLDESKKVGVDQSRLGEALTLIEEAVELFPDRAEARWGLATTLHHLNRIPESLATYRRLVDDFPEQPRFLFEMGLLTVKSDNQQILTGIGYIVEAMTKSREFDTFLSKLGDLYLLSGKVEQAQEAYARFLALFPMDYETWTKSGDALYRLGTFEQAATAYRKALEVKPDFQPALQGLGRLGHTPPPVNSPTMGLTG